MSQSAVSNKSVEGVEKLREKIRQREKEKLEQQTGESRGKQLWRILRTSVRPSIEAVKKADITDIHVSHGVHHSRKINHRGAIQQVIYNKNKKEYLTIDDNCIRIFKQDGRKKDLIDPEEELDRLCYASKIDQYVGWNYNGKHLVLMNNEFEVYSVNKATTDVFTVVYNENNNEIITGGVGCLTSWVFRYGNRHLIPRKTAIAQSMGSEKFSIVVLEETASRSQKVFAATGTGVAIFSVYDGSLISCQKDLHVRTITALVFFNPLKYLITGSKDGSIKVWDETWHLQLVFIGHNERVSCLSVYPFGPFVMSASYDCSIRVWSLETCDEVDKIDTDLPVQGMGTMIYENNFFSFSTHSVDLWDIKHIHALHTAVGYRVNGIKHTDHPGKPVRSVLLCKDSSVRIVAPTSGDVITTLLIDPKEVLVDAAYAIEDEILFAVFENGDILKADTTTNPATIVARWRCGDEAKACNYLLVYEYVVDAVMQQDDTWLGMIRAIATKAMHAATSTQKHKNKTLLLGGRKDGYICVFNWETGKVSFEIEAHGSKGVLNMIANSVQDQLISAGKDNIIKVWRLFPFAQEALAPLMSFYCAQTPLHMCVMKGKLAVAFQEHTTATYSVVVYNLTTKRRHDHTPDEDHTDSITGITCCPRMKLFASSSNDGTVKVWNEENKLVRELKLNAVPHSVGFCSQRGNILVGIGNHLHMIDYTSYMPRAQRFRMVMMTFTDEEPDKPIAFNENLVNRLSKDNQKRLKAAHSSFKFTHFMDILSDEENEEVTREKREREKAFAILEARDLELCKIRDGELKASRKPRKTVATKRTAFEKYLKIFYNRPKLDRFKGTEFEDDLAKEMAEGVEDEGEDEFVPETGPLGFFPPPEQAVKTEPPQKAEETAPEAPEPAQAAPPGEPLQPYYPINPRGFIPNSILARLLWPKREPPPKREDDGIWKPPQLTEEQLALAKAGRKPKKRAESPVFIDYGSPEVPVEEEPKSEFLSKMTELMERPPTPKTSQPEFRFSLDTIEEGMTPEPEPEPIPPEPPKQPKKQVKPRKPIVKLVSRPPPPTPPPPKIKTPPPPPSPTPTPPPPRPVTPLPQFIQQFIGEEWFDKYFPNCTPETFPKPWTVTSLVNMLLRLLKIAEYKYKSDVITALKTLYQQEGLEDQNTVIRTILAVLSPAKNPPTCLDPDQKKFIQSAINMLQLFGLLSKTFIIELMVQFLDGDQEMRMLILDTLHYMGMLDPHKFFPRELDSWDVWSIEGDGRRGELQQRCNMWLDRWMTAFKMHLETTIEKIKRGQSVHGRMSRGSLKSPTKGILKKPGTAEQGERPEDSATGRSITVAFDTLDSSVVDNATYIEAINYFCEMEMEKELAKLRRRESEDKVVEAKNTVLVLPKIGGKPSLVRLGETHTSRCHKHRETNLAIDYRLPAVTARGKQPDPGQLQGFAPSIILPMKTVYMNPFPSPIDAYDTWNQEPILLTLKSSQKYFVHTQSYVNDFDAFL